MKILLLAPHPFYQERGTPIAVRLLAETLAEDGHTIDQECAGFRPSLGADDRSLFRDVTEGGQSTHLQKVHSPRCNRFVDGVHHLS